MIRRAVKQEMVAIAPTPSPQQQKSAAGRNRLQSSDNQRNAALEIAQQPPETWYKDQYGRKATFGLRVQRTQTFCAQCVEQRILAVQLLYESGKAVEKQEILHVMSGQCLDKNRQSTLAVRIAEVSKNHLNQRFRLEIAVPKCLGGCDYETSVVTDPVLVLSKKKKRPVKRNAVVESPAQTKKAKRSLQGTPMRKLSSESPDSSQSSSTVTGSVTAAIVEMEEAVPPRTTGSMAPFAPNTPNLCLWANAAFDLLYKLQWQRVPASATDKPGANLDEILAQAMSKAYKCPSCHETYGQVPTHRDDCDLKLLLEQGGQTETSGTGSDVAANHASQWAPDKHFEWPNRSKAMFSGGDVTPKVQTSPHNTSQDELGSGPRRGQARPQGFYSSAAPGNPTISSWKDYASLSKLLYSTSYLDAKSPQAGTALSPTLQWTGVLPPVGTLSPGFPTLPSATKSSAIYLAGAHHSMGSQRFSALLSATKDMSPDTADLFRETESALHGDGNIVNSLDGMSLSDIIQPKSGDFLGTNIRSVPLPSSVLALLPGDHSKVDMSAEKDVQSIMCCDFRDCGFPALDGSFNLVGFYQLLTETHDTPAELCFTPNLFPLPEEMLQQLENTVIEWKQDPAICHKRQEKESNSEVSLDLLKRAVLRAVTR